MKYILTFLFGGVCGAGAMLLLFRKEIKKELESRETAEKCDEMPFTMGEGNDSGNDTKSLREAKNGLRSENDAAIAARKDAKIAYHKIVQETKENSIPVTPRDEDLFKKADVPDVIKAEPPKEFVDAIPISKDEFKEDNGMYIFAETTSWLRKAERSFRIPPCWLGLHGKTTSAITQRTRPI